MGMPNGLPKTPATGSSLAAPQVAGTLALLFEHPIQNVQYYCSFGKTPPRAFDFLHVNAKPRPNAGLLGALARPLTYNCAESFCFPAPAGGVGGAAAVVQRDDANQCNTVWVQPTGAPGPSPPATTTSILPVITDGSGSGTCGNGRRQGHVGINSKPIDKNVLQNCLLNLDTSKWLDARLGDAYDCDGMVSFQSASVSWRSPADCHNSCKNCLSEQIANGTNQVWCDAYAGTFHCWEGFVITPPPLVTDGTPWPNGQTQQTIQSSGYTEINNKYIDEYAVQNCIRNLQPTDWFLGDQAYDCGGMLHFAMWNMYGWNSPNDCWNAIKMCLSVAVDARATEAYCESWAGVTHCRGGFYPRLG